MEGLINIDEMRKILFSQVTKIQDEIKGFTVEHIGRAQANIDCLTKI